MIETATGDVSHTDTFAEWRHWVVSTFMPVECVPAAGEPFHGEMAHWALGGLRITRCVAGPHVAARTPRMIALGDQDYFKVGLLLRGSCRLAQNDHQALLRAGDLAIYDCRRPYSMEFDEPFSMYFLMFPPDRLRLPPGALSSVLARRVSSREATGSLVGPFVRGLVQNLERGEGRVNRRLAENTIDLLATLFGELGGAPPDPAASRGALLLGVHQWIEEHLGEPGLGPEAIARANHLSVRYLHRLFHDQGTTVARWVRERRLDNCRRDLEDPVLAGRVVVVIARRWGFDDPAHFSKIFKAAYGVSPGQYRHQALAAVGDRARASAGR